MKRIVIAGASECGKTTLAIYLSRQYWRQRRIATLALDPYKHEHDWGQQAWVTTSESEFFGEWDESAREFRGGAIWKRHGDLVVVDEGSSTIARDRSLVPLFTKIRHNKHTLLVICHDATDLIPTMRRNVNELFLFLQAEKAIKLWSEDLPGMSGLEKAGAEHCPRLESYQFIHCNNFGTATAKRVPYPLPK